MAARRRLRRSPAAIDGDLSVAAIDNELSLAAISVAKLMLR
jgi:hypothetical protein